MPPAPHSHPTDYSQTSLRPVNWSDELEKVRQLFQGYREWLAEHVPRPLPPATGEPEGLIDFDRVISALPGVYGPPRGDVILAVRDSEIVACGALREWGPGVGEIKRIYVRPDHRGPGFGPVLTGALLERARGLGYERVRVDTLGTMTAAIQFYQEMGFRPIPAYWAHPAPGALFFEWRAPAATRARSRPTHARRTRPPGRRPGGRARRAGRPKREPVSRR